MGGRFPGQLDDILTQVGFQIFNVVCLQGFVETDLLGGHRLGFHNAGEVTGVEDGKDLPDGLGGIGALRMPDLYTRMHAASLTDTMAAILILGGIMLQAGMTLATIKLAAILLFLLLTSPTASNALEAAAMLAGNKPGIDTTSGGDGRQ